MDGKKQWWWVLPLFVLALQKIIRNKINPPSKAPNPSRWDDMPVTQEEEEAWRDLENKQGKDLSQGG